MMKAAEGKSAIASVGFWGSIISIVPLFIESAADLGIELGTLGVFGPHSAAIVAGIGGLISLYGRVTAKKPITGVIFK